LQGTGGITIYIVRRIEGRLVARLRRSGHGVSLLGKSNNPDVEKESRIDMFIIHETMKRSFPLTLSAG
jgi:hypothetical protein